MLVSVFPLDWLFLTCCHFHFRLLCWRMTRLKPSPQLPCRKNWTTCWNLILILLKLWVLSRMCSWVLRTAYCCSVVNQRATQVLGSKRNHIVGKITARPRLQGSPTVPGPEALLVSSLSYLGRGFRQETIDWWIKTFEGWKIIFLSFVSVFKQNFILFFFKQNFKLNVLLDLFLCELLNVNFRWYLIWNQILFMSKQLHFVSQ